MHNLMIDPKVDIRENDILKLSPELLNTLLKDHTLSTEDKQVNIFWATDNYADKGAGFQYKDQITFEAITGVNGDIIVPRALKSRATQQIDQQLYKKYALNDNEIAFIESMIKPI